MSITEKLLTIEQVAKQLSVSKDSVRRMITRGDIRRVKVMGLVRIPESDVQRICQTESCVDRAHLSSGSVLGKGKL